MVMEDFVDPDYVPTEAEVLEYAEWLEMDVEKDKDLLWIAAEGLKAPLPKPWKPCQTSDNREIFYFNFDTGESVWDHPCDAKFKRLLGIELKKKRGHELTEDDEEFLKKAIDVSRMNDCKHSLVTQQHQSAATEVGIAVEWNLYATHLHCKVTFPEGVYVGAPAKYWHQREYDHDTESIMGYYDCKVDITECDGILTSLQGYEMGFKWKSKSDYVKESIDVTNWKKSLVPQKRVLQIHAELNNGRDLLVETTGLDGSSVAKFTIDFGDTLGSLRSHLGQELSGSELVSGLEIISDTDDTLIINTKLVRGIVLQAQAESI